MTDNMHFRLANAISHAIIVYIMFHNVGRYVAVIFVKVAFRSTITRASLTS